MKYLLIIMFLLFHVPALAGPFGLEMGMTLEQIDPNAHTVSPGLYATTKIPKPHSAFGLYGVTVAPKSGLCVIKALSNDIKTSSQGKELVHQFKLLGSKLEAIYGPAEILNKLNKGSMWNKPEHFMMGLKKNERHVIARWKNESGEPLKGNISEIGLICIALGQNKGQLKLEYAFINQKECNAEIAALEDDAL